MVSTILRCSNPVCDFRLRLLVGMPIWKPDTPPNLVKTPIGVINRAWVAGYADQRFCTVCEEIVEVGEDMGCSACGKNGHFLMKGDTCPACKVGRIESERGTVF